MADGTYSGVSPLAVSAKGISFVKNIMAPTRDGTRLALDIHVPAGNGPWPAHQTDGEYWRPGSIRGRYHDIKASALLTGGWRDGCKKSGYTPSTITTIGVRALRAELLGFSEFGRVEPSLRLRHTSEFHHHDVVRHPVAFHDFGCAATHQILAPILRDGRRGSLAKFSVEGPRSSPRYALWRSLPC